MSLHAHRLGARVPGPPARWLFRELDLTIARGQVWVLVGPNGSGKSTLLRCLAGLRAPDDGETRLHARPLHELPARDRAKQLAYLPQLTSLYHDLRVRQLVMLGRAPHLSRWRGPDRHDQHRVDEALARVQATELATRRISTLSGGERQRVMLARLLATGAQILLLDEPTTALDVGHALRLLALCRELAAEGAAIVLALHELELARRHADHAVCLGVGADGAHHHGPARDVLTAHILGSVFDVDVREHPGGLSFHPRR
ncbi:ABC transporter ATP-binding protein [Paraliomyxa miuraensis]|uniref:ABC transporter ATP-binding protein n=1 Tax=Paraliomyxa miuraensis TaxID=376150 RepID=UPI002B1CDD29|nr:ABC transporter ATP-binding protein [Paraliomyxa miuraensis]MCX4245443.1 ABC transporter ATP-binding protein [Paraliomyxa miuraensis]